MTNASPLVPLADDRPFAWLTTPLRGLAQENNGRIVSRNQFLAHVLRMAERLPATQHVINLCESRYLFLVATWAAIARGQTTLLPPNRNAATQADLAARYANCVILHDAMNQDLSADLAELDVSKFDWRLANASKVSPQIDSDQAAIISFTSGSTGQSRPNPKNWRTLRESSKINARYMLPNSTQIHYQLATVPGQHMWGLETSVLLPVFANAALVDSKPLYPADVLEALAQLPAPRNLITTPFHLRALLHSLSGEAVACPEIAVTLCATAPLDTALAQQQEAVAGGELREVYGCSEVGSMAVRRTAQSALWRRFDGIHFSHMSDGRTQASAAYLPSVVDLDDLIDVHSDDEFSLRGRASDQIKIAGKRGSLQEVNAILNRFSGLQDGVVFFPQQPQRSVPRLVAIVVLQDGVEKAALRDHLRSYLDAAFVPRPIFVVPSLPREANGKLPKTNLLTLYDSLKRTQ
ncbi:AMP-ligase [Arenicella chitinivorans]|uniref:AMP-ligase n=1 Tax=Arenicella chitinivorans TaxID=1329800 RepID=A0A918RW23_9GAMM|nr:AMP-binding protein [Arenicella chitinivorans]GHA14706.1 AMP-ligase [Arenicella chitinivorans]